MLPSGALKCTTEHVPFITEKFILSVSDLEVINLFSIKDKLIPKCKNKLSYSMNTEFDTQLLCSLFVLVSVQLYPLQRAFYTVCAST